jgi:hypothetical protein
LVNRKGIKDPEREKEKEKTRLILTILFDKTQPGSGPGFHKKGVKGDEI